MSQIIPEMENMIKLWYNTDAVAFEMINNMKFKESVFIATNKRATQRCLKINAVRFLFKNLERYHAYDSDYQYNIYHSVAHFPKLPMFSFKWEDKREEQDKFNLNYVDYMEGYDFFLDLDNENINLVYTSTTIAKKLFDLYNTPYNLIFSGKKGFHISIEYKNLPRKLQSMEYKKLARLFKLFAYELKITKKIKDIDTGIFDLKRIKKVPYSVVYPYYNVALPLSDEQFNNFKIMDMNLANWIDKVEQIKRRGLLTRNGSAETFLLLINDISKKRAKIEKLFQIMKIHKQTLHGFMEQEGVNHLALKDEA